VSEGQGDKHHITGAAQAEESIKVDHRANTITTETIITHTEQASIRASRLT
jgi:hypothetical protein